MRVWVAPHAHQYLLWSAFFHLAIFVHVMWKEQLIKCKTYLLVLNIGCMQSWTPSFVSSAPWYFQKFSVGSLTPCSCPLTRPVVQNLGLSLCSRNWQIPWRKYVFHLLWFFFFLWLETAIIILLSLTVSVGKKFGKVQLRVFHEVAVSAVKQEQWKLQQLDTGSSCNLGASLFM